jgi:Ca2+-transporting ATPase
MWHGTSVDEVLEELGSDARSGLSEEEVRVRRERYGPNLISEGKKKSLVVLFFSQLNSMLIYILFAAAGISALLGETTDTIIIVCVILLNALIGVIQEAKAEKALEALKRLATPMAVVIREGRQVEIPSEDLVPGDLVVIEAGRMVPCDLRLIETAGLRVEESPLTGESLPVDKDAEAVIGRPDIPLGDRRDMAFMSTVAIHGRGVGVAVATGMHTEIGHIASMLDEDEHELTPLQRRLDLLGRRLGGVILGLCALIFMVSLVRPLIGAGVIERSHLIELMLTAISLAVAAIPEGLPAIVTIVLALGVQRMVRRNAIVRSLPAVETLGSVNVICSDKTGTLTQNRMTVTRFHAGGVSGGVEDLDPDNGVHAMLLHCLVLCNDAAYEPGSSAGDFTGRRAGDPTEIALLEAGYRHGVRKENLEKLHPRLAEKPFDSDRKLMSTIHAYEGRYAVMTKGALDRLLSHCNTVFTRGEPVRLTDSRRQAFLDAADAMAGEALRVLAAAVKLTDEDLAVDVQLSGETPAADGLEENLSLIGIVGMMDPPRLEVKESIERCTKSGIRTVMITGDHRKTAMAIARPLAIAEDPAQVISGSELDALSDGELAIRARSLRVYARVSPAHKVRIVKALKAQGNIVSMTGDGVNDAPSLQAADIGVAMGITGTDVAKGASDMVLTDDNFTTIVAAIEEGRNIYNNIRKSVLFLLSCNAGEIIAIFLSILLGWPTPLLPLHILWVNLITDTLPALALGMDPGDPRVLEEPPRDPHESLFAGGGVVHVIGNGMLIGLITLFAYRYGTFRYPGSLVHARTLAFAVLSLAQLFHAFNLRHMKRSIFGLGLFSNAFLLGAFAVGVVLQVSVVSVRPFASVFKVYGLGPRDWLLVFLLALVPILVNEIVKVIRRIRP